MRHKVPHGILTALFFLAVLSACQKEPVTFLSGRESEIRAGATYGDGTKAIVRTSVPGSFTLYACSYTGSVPAGVDYIYGETMTKSGSVWVSAHKFARVEPDRTVKYFAVHPSDAVGLTLPDIDMPGVPYFRYVLPSDADDQADIIIASKDYNGSQSNISLAFSHILAAVDFKFSVNGAFDGTIKTVTIRGIDTRGLYTLGGGWSRLSTRGGISQTLNMAVTESMSGQAITSESRAMMLIPQTTEPEAELEMVVNDGVSDRVLRCSLAGRRFDAGKEYTVRVDLSAAGGLTLTISSVDMEDWIEVGIEVLLSRRQTSIAEHRLDHSNTDGFRQCENRSLPFTKERWIYATSCLKTKS